jgi:hypothetical protein
MKPILIPGGFHSDQRGCVTYNNDINFYGIKRIYTIENNNINFKRGWQGHKIEQRWFVVMKGSFEIEVLDIKYFEENIFEMLPIKYLLKSEKMDLLHVPPGYVTSIRCLEIDSKLLLMSDFLTGEVDDEIRYPL